MMNGNLDVVSVLLGEYVHLTYTYLKGLVIEQVNAGKLSWFTPQIPATARAWLGQSWERGPPSRSPA